MQKEALLTFETIYEILRREKNKADIQPLDKEFYDNIKNYLKDKQEIYEKSLVKTDIFSITERPNIALQLHNTKKIIKELYDKREKKIMEMALIASKTKTNIINVENLLDPEKKLFQELISILDKYRQQYTEEISPEDLKTEQEPQTKQEAQKQKAPTEHYPTENSENNSINETKNIQFTEFTEAFFGKELEEYGPYNKGDTAELPQEIAQILITQGKAQSF